MTPIYDMSTDTRLIYRSRSVGQHIDQHISRVSVEISADTSRSRVGRYVDRNIGRASVDMSTNISVEGCTNYTLSNVCMLPLSLLPYFLHAARWNLTSLIMTTLLPFSKELVWTFSLFIMELARFCGYAVLGRPGCMVIRLEGPSFVYD